MVKEPKTKIQRMHSMLVALGLRSRSPFRSPTGSATRWSLAILAALFLALLIPLFLPDRFQRGPLAAEIVIGWIVSMFATIGFGAHFAMKERASFVAATMHAPDEKDLPAYITAFFHSDEKVQAQAAPIVSELLGRLSTDKLACISDVYWIRLCPIPDDTRSGYFKDKNVELYDQVHAAAFSAIKRLKRIQSLPRIEMWMSRRKTNSHSAAFVRALYECHETLLNHQANLPQSSTLLRPSSVDATAPDGLLRPVVGTSQTENGSGQQLLRAAMEPADNFASGSGNPTRL